MQKLFIEIANTHLKREQGLMGRKKLANNHGMLFDFPYPNRLSFYMRNTYVPLDIAFINEEGVVTEIKSMVPLTTNSIVSRERCKYALEVNRGWFDKNNIVPGSVVKGHGMKQDSKNPLIAQMTPQDLPLNGETQDPNLSPPQPQQENPNPVVMLDRTFKEIFEQADLQGKDLIIIYQTKDRGKEGNKALPPKTISPPYLFEKDAEGHPNALVKAWDNQDASWKSFLIDNIIRLEEKEEKEEKEENTLL